jgi:hypothetical protein
MKGRATVPCNARATVCNGGAATPPYNPPVRGTHAGPLHARLHAAAPSEESVAKPSRRRDVLLPLSVAAPSESTHRETLQRLLALAQAQADISARQVAELKVLLAEGTYQPEQEWISLKTAEHEYGIVNKTARRWAKELGLGRLNGRGQWELSRSRVRAFLARTARPR